VLLTHRISWDKRVSQANGSQSQVFERMNAGLSFISKNNRRLLFVYDSTYLGITVTKDGKGGRYYYRTRDIAIDWKGLDVKIKGVSYRDSDIEGISHLLNFSLPGRIIRKDIYGHTSISWEKFLILQIIHHLGIEKLFH